jgi:hypothetical protein
MSRLPVRSAVAAAALSVFVLAGCASPAGEVNVLQSSTATVVPGSTYAWAPITSSSQRASDPRVANDIIQQRIVGAFDNALAAKGYRKVSNPSQATLLVSYYVGLEARQDVRSDTMGPPPAVACGFRGCVGGWGFYGAPTLNVETINYTEGTVIFDLVDRSSGELAWRATSQQRVDSGDADQARLNAIAADMIKTLPGNAPAGGR